MENDNQMYKVTYEALLNGEKTNITKDMLSKTMQGIAHTEEDVIRLFKLEQEIMHDWLNKKIVDNEHLENKEQSIKSKKPRLWYENL